MTTTQKTRQIVENCYGVLAIEMIAAAQALDIREGVPGAGVNAAHEIIRKYINHLDEDRALFPDNDTMVDLLLSGEILESVESTVGALN